MNENMIMDLDVLNIHCDSIDNLYESAGLGETPFDFDTDLDRLEWMVIMMFTQKDLMDAIEKAERRIKREKREKEKLKQSK